MLVQIDHGFGLPKDINNHEQKDILAFQKSCKLPVCFLSLLFVYQRYLKYLVLQPMLYQYKEFVKN